MSATWSAVRGVTEDASTAAALAASLPRFLRHRLTFEASLTAQRQRLAGREAAWLALVRTAVYEHRPSPYRRLLRRAGVELGDLEGLVRREGLEGTLKRLFREGVYLTIEEFKGRRPVIRGVERFHVNPGLLRNPRASVHGFARSGGSRGLGTPVPIDLGFLREQSTNTCLIAHARRGSTWRKAHWMVPGGGAIIMILTYAGFGSLPVRWFSQLDWNATGMPARYRWSARLVCLISRLVGRPIPSPRYVPLTNPGPVLDWMVDTLRCGEIPWLQTLTSSAVRVCQAAAAAGIDLSGARFTLGGEPVTAARLRAVQSVGAVGLVHYGAVETGSALSLGCLDPQHPDDSHLTNDLHAFIQPGSASRPPRSAESGPAADLSRRALLITSLRMRAPLVLLNVSLGDEAVLERRPCACPLEEYGWVTHAHTIRSFEKLTAAGMSFLDVDAIRVLEEILPARFGGRAGDYQLVEEEAEDGASRLALCVHPEVGPVDTRALATAFLDGLGRGEDAKHVMAEYWRDAGLLRVERRSPAATGTGKVLHLHRLHRSSPASSRAGA